MAPSPLRKPEKRADLLDRLQAVSTVARTSANDIIDGLFPEQASYLVASRLLAIAANDTRLVACQDPTSDSELPLLSPPRSGRKRTRRVNQRATPLQPLRPLSPVVNDHIDTGLSHAELALVLWDAKMERQQLSREDLLFLLLREDTVRVLESARLLRLSRVSYEQAMELELTLESMRSEDTRKLALQSRVRPRKQPSLATVLSRNAWMHCKAFAARQSPVSPVSSDPTTRNCAQLTVISQDLSPPKATAQMRTRPANRIATALPPSTSCDSSTRQHTLMVRNDWEPRLRCGDPRSRFSPTAKKPQQMSISGTIGKCLSSQLVPRRRHYLLTTRFDFQ